MWPGFDSGPVSWWVKFVVGSRPCSEGFSPSSPVFHPPQKLTSSQTAGIEDPNETHQGSFLSEYCNLFEYLFLIRACTSHEALVPSTYLHE